MKKSEKRKLKLSRETLASLEAGKLAGAAGGYEQPAAFSDLWAQTTCL